MLSGFFRGRDRKKAPPYSIENTAANYVFTSPSDCTAHELIMFLLDLHMYLVPLGHEIENKFPDPTVCVQYSFEVSASSTVLRSVNLLSLLGVSFIENTFESADALRQLSDDVVISAIKDLAILGKQVPCGQDFTFDSSAVMPLDGILACVDILVTVLNSSQCFLEREYSFTSRLLPALSGMFFILDRIGCSIGHASTDVTKYQWTQAVGQSLKYLNNLAINVTVHNVNCTMDMDTELPPIHGSINMGFLVKILQLLANSVVIVREWCQPDAASTIALLFWSAADAVSDAVLHLQSKDKYISVSDGIRPAGGERPECTKGSLWKYGDFLSVITHSIYKCITNASPAPQDMLAGIGRLAGRSNENYNSEISVADGTSEMTNMLNWCAVAHTITGFKSLLRAAVFSATGDKIALPRQNEWVSAITESLLFCLEFGYRCRNLTLLAPVMAEILLELIVRQSDCSVNVDNMFFELAAQMTKFSDYYKKKSRIEKKKGKRPKRSQSGFASANNLIDQSISTDSRDADVQRQLPVLEVRLDRDDSPIRRVQSDDTKSYQKDKHTITVEKLKKHNNINQPKIARVVSKESSSFDAGALSEILSVHTDYDDFIKSSRRDDDTDIDPKLSPLTKGRPTSSIRSPLTKTPHIHLAPLGEIPHLSPGGDSTRSLEKSPRRPLGQPLRIENPAGSKSSSSFDGEKSGSGKKKKKSVSGKDSQHQDGMFTSVVCSPRAPVPHEAEPGSETIYTVGQLVDCRIPIKNGTMRWFSGKIEALNADGTHNVRFDDGDLGEGKKGADIRISKRSSGRHSARSSAPSVRSDTPPSSRGKVLSVSLDSINKSSSGNPSPAMSPSSAAGAFYTVSQKVDCRITMHNDTKRFFSGAIEMVHADGTYNVRFDDGDLGENKSSADIRASKRPSRHAARSPCLSARSDTVQNSAQVQSLSIDPKGVLSSPEPPLSTTPTGSKVGNPAMFGPANFGNSQGSSIGISFDLTKFPIQEGDEISPPAALEEDNKLDSMCYSTDDEDSVKRIVTQPYRPSDKAARSLPTIGADSISTEADSDGLFFINGAPHKQSLTASKEKQKLVMTDIDEEPDMGGVNSDEDDDDDGFTFSITPVFAEEDIARRVKMGGDLVSKIDFANVDMDVTAAMNGAAQTSLSGGIVRDIDSTIVRKHSSEEEEGEEGEGSGEDEDDSEDTTGDNDFGLAYLYDTNVSDQSNSQSTKADGVVVVDKIIHNLHAQETDSEQLETQSKDSNYSFSNSSGRASVDPALNKMKRVPSLKGLHAATNAQSTSEINNFHNNTLGSFNMLSKNAAQPPRPSSTPHSNQTRSRNEVHSRQQAARDTDVSSVNGGGSVVSNSSGTDHSGGSDPECRIALQRTYAFVSLVLLERSIAQRDRIDDKFCKPEETLTTNRSRNSSYRLQNDFDSSGLTDANDYGHRNVVFAVREFLDTLVGRKSFAAIAANATMIDQSTTRLLKLIGESYFDSCIPGHMKSATRLAEGAFGNVYRVTCPVMCSKCYSRKSVRQQQSHRRSLADEDSPTMTGEEFVYAVKRISRERSVYDMPVLLDVFAEVTCLELLSQNKGVCRLFNYGIQGAEYWLVLEEGKMDLLVWRKTLDLSSECTIRDLETCVALYEDACVIIRSIHEAGIIHFDLKCSNFLLRGNPSRAVKWWSSCRHSGFELQPSGVLFLADFGESVINKVSGEVSSLIRPHNNAFSVGDGKSPSAAAASPSHMRGGPTVLTSPKFRGLLKDEIWSGVDLKRARGTLFVQAPEMLIISSGGKSAGLPTKEGKFRKQKKDKGGDWIHFSAPSYSSDVWSLGCLLVELITMSPLFTERPWPELYCLLCMKGKKPDIDVIINDAFEKYAKSQFISSSSAPTQAIYAELQSIVPRILVQRPLERPSITHIMSTLAKISTAATDGSFFSHSALNLSTDPSIDSWGDPSMMDIQMSGPTPPKSDRGTLILTPLTVLKKAKRPLKPLQISTSGSALKYSIEQTSSPVSPMVINKDAKPSGKLYTDVHEYLSSAVDSFDDVKMLPGTCAIAPKLLVSLSLCSNDAFSYDLSNGLVVDITAAPSALYEYNTTNILGECMSRVRNSEKYASVAAYNSDLVQKTVGYLHKDNRLVEIILVCENQCQGENGHTNETLEDTAGCFFFKLKKRKGEVGEKKGNSWIPWGDKWRNNKVYVTDHVDTTNKRREVYKFNLGVGDPAMFFECFKHAVLFVHKCIQDGNTVLLSISGRHDPVVINDAASSRPGSSRWTVQGDGPAPALSARSHSFDSNMRKMFTSGENRVVANGGLSARSLASSRSGEGSFYPSSTGTRLSTTTGMLRPQQGDFSRPLMSALAALTACTVVMTKAYSNFYDQPIAPLEKMAPWLLRGCQKETVMSLIQYSRLVLKPETTTSSSWMSGVS